MHGSRPLLGLVLLGTLLTIALGCRQEVPPLFRRNRPPETTLTIAPPESSSAFYRYHVYWRGEDPDGEVVRYLFAITDTLAEDPEDRWDPTLADDVERGVFTTKTDSVFFFNSQAGRQAFNIVAIDDFGEQDPSPARKFFKVSDNGLPRVVHLDVPIDTDDPNTFPCVSTEPCTIPTFTNFQMRFSARTNNGHITGYTWQAPPQPWQPFGDPDTNFVRLDEIDGDTLVVDDDTGRPVWALSEGQDTVTVYLYSSRHETILDAGRVSGNIKMRARALDDAKLQSRTSENGERTITINFDPDTRMFTVPECDCPGRASAPCGNQVPAGWVTGIGEIDSLGTIEDWVLFCEGDTLSNLSIVRFYANGWDDERDNPIDSTTTVLPEVTYSFRFGLSGAGFTDNSMRLSVPRPARNLTLPMSVGGGTFRGATADWKTCAFDYRFEAAAVDEHGRDDGTPATARFFVGGSPTIDSLQVPSVLVFVPSCPQTRLGFCPDYQNITFGPDTVAVFGTSEPDDINPINWQTAYGLGWNTFVLPFKAFGHDHPRDKNPPGGPEYYRDVRDEGHIRAWKFNFDCTEPSCEDLSVIGEDKWGPNSVQKGEAINVFDDVLTVARIVLDTLCVAAEGGGCSVPNSRASLLFSRFGEYLFEIQGRDTEPIAQTCPQPISLDDGAQVRDRPISRSGRLTQLVQKEVLFVQLSDVRPLSMKPGSARREQSRPFTSRKRLMR